MAKQQSFFSKAFSGIVSKAVNTPFVSSITQAYSQLLTPLLRREYLREYKNWVFSCVQARAEEIGNTQLILLRNGEEVDVHPVLDLLNHPNPVMTRHDLFESYQAFKDLEGNCFWYLARENNGKGAPVEIWPLRPDRVQIVPDNTNPLQIMGYIYTQPDGQKIKFQPQEVIHFKNFNPLGNHPFPHRGIGIVEAASWAIDTDNEARNYNYRFFKNSARPDGILTTAGDGALDPDSLLRLREEWQSMHGGSENSSKVAILGGGLSWTEISRSQKDMDFINQRTFSRDEILALFRTPKSIIGITDDVNRANADAAIYVFALRTIKPLMEKFVDHMNELLLPEFGDDLEFDYESPVAEDRKESLDVYQAGLAQGWLSINEVREEEGLPRVETGDGLYLPLNMVEVATVVPEPEPTKSIPAKKRNSSTAAKAVEKLIESQKAKGTLPASEKTFSITSLDEARKQAYITQWKAGIKQNTVPLQRALKNYFDKQEKQVMQNAREQLKGFLPDEFKYKSAVDFLFSEPEAVSLGVSLITPFIKEYIKNSGEAAAGLIGSTFDPSTDVLNKFIASRAQYFAKTINDTTSEDLLNSIKQGLDDGEDLSAIQDRIAGVYDIAKGSRTQMIARTEVSAASNQGAIGAYTQAGVSQIEWAVVDPTDEDCIENDGEIVDIGDEFPSGDTEPPVHPNCECTTLPVFKDGSDNTDGEDS